MAFAFVLMSLIVMAQFNFVLRTALVARTEPDMVLDIVPEFCSRTISVLQVNLKQTQEHIKADVSLL